jgi:hypothetical protein
MPTIQSSMCPDAPTMLDTQNTAGSGITLSLSCLNWNTAFSADSLVHCICTLLNTDQVLTDSETEQNMSGTMHITLVEVENTKVCQNIGS